MGECSELRNEKYIYIFFFKQKTAYEIGTGDWSSDVCSSDLVERSLEMSAVSEKLDRADKVLVALGHFESRSAAQAAIAAGKVKVRGNMLDRKSTRLNSSHPSRSRMPSSA